MNEASAQAFFGPHRVDDFIAFISILRFMLIFLVDLGLYASVVDHVQHDNTGF